MHCCTTVLRDRYFCKAANRSNGTEKNPTQKPATTTFYWQTPQQRAWEKILRKMRRKGFMLCTHTQSLTLRVNNKSIYSMCVASVVTVWLCVCTNWCKWKDSSGCTVRLPHWGPLITFIIANRYLLAHQPTPHRPRLVHLYGFLSKTKASIDSKPLCGTRTVKTVLWISILPRERQGDTFKAVMTNYPWLKFLQVIK